MRLLFCCEFYHPSVGGVQEVMRQLAERMVQWGHDVTVATTRLSHRGFDVLNGVKIAQFGVSGNSVRGMEGEVTRYQEYVASFDGDALLIKAAQQWTFDALWPVLDTIKARKVFIPCGFSGLYEPSYKSYFEQLPDILRRFDHLIFYAEKYRDIDFARAHGLTNWSILPNGASEVEFSAPNDPSFRRRHSIPKDSFVFLTVGSMTGMKGHRELAEAFSLLDSRGKHVTLILNGNMPLSASVIRSNVVKDLESPALEEGYLRKAWGVTLCMGDFLLRRGKRVGGLAYRSIGVMRREGLAGVKNRLQLIVLSRLGSCITKTKACQRTLDPLGYWMGQASKQKNKRVLQLDLPRGELVQAYMAADLFVFASNVEYSPLVLFESVAAGTPFLSVPVGNAEEIARWTEGGVMCAAPKDDYGYTRVDPSVLATAMKKCMCDSDLLKILGEAGRERWKSQFTWAVIGRKYEAILQSNNFDSAAFP
ncbi:MAG: alpha-L-glycero-D-manno-heptose alpha,3-glucosyltransferase [Proteobacteria bacterium]|nr:alpha-L-glycero-D-manno-heptose alpha,3-glucosyltransferase [Pseudomonadota bacterium]